MTSSSSRPPSDAARNAVAESTRRFRQAFELNPLAESIVRFEDAVFIEVNDAFCHILDWERDDIIGRSAYDIGLWENRAAREGWSQVLEQLGSVRNYRTDWFTRTGRRLHMRVSATVIDLDGVPCILSISIDDTAAIKAEKALLSARQELADIFSFLPDATFVIDRRGVVIAWNRAMEENTNILASDMLGKGNFEVGLRLYEERRPVLADLILQGPNADLSRFQSVSREGNTLYGESDDVVMRGKRRTVTSKASLLYNAEQEIIGAIQQVRDVTELREAQQRLDLVENQVRQLSLAVEQSPLSILITDLTGRIEYVNPHFVTTTGYSRAELVGQTPGLLNSGKNPRTLYGDMWQRLRQGQPWIGEFVNRHKDGSEHITYASIQPIHQPNGSITHYLAIQQDITEQKAVAEELAQHRHHLEKQVRERTLQLAAAKESAEAASRSKSTFLANMSHEIRTPMNAIIGITHLLQQAELGTVQRNQVAKMAKASQHLLGILNDLLDFSKIEAGKVTLENAEVDLRQLVEHVLAMVHDKADEKRLALHAEFAPNLPRAVLGDPLRLGQILLNYLSNAVKFTHRGRITVRMRTEGIPAPGKVALLLEVEDQGIGMSEAQQQRTFQVFEQADASTTRKYGGTGLGLALCKRLAQLMGGQVGVVSWLGAGSTFWLRLALSVVETPSGSTARPSEVDKIVSLAVFQAARVLLVEDNLINQEVTLDLLHSLGLNHVEVARHGGEALALAQVQRFDLVLMDVQMPVMDGLEATRRIRALPGWEKVPIIALTANVFADDRDHCLTAGMNDLIGKPINTPLLSARLAHWLAWAGIGDAASAVEFATDIPVATIESASLPQTERLAPLLALPGVACRRAVDNLRGRVDSYLRLVRHYAETHCDDGERIRRAWADGRHDDAVRMAHSLKGVSGTLGFDAVQNAATALDAALRGSVNDEREQCIAHLESELRAACAAIAAVQ